MSQPMPSSGPPIGPLGGGVLVGGSVGSGDGLGFELVVGFDELEDGGEVGVDDPLPVPGEGVTAVVVVTGRGLPRGGALGTAAGAGDAWLSGASAGGGAPCAATSVGRVPGAGTPPWSGVVGETGTILASRGAAEPKSESRCSPDSAAW